MAKDPAFLFYSADFMIGVAFMTYVQRGKYISLLCYQHQLGHLTEQQMLDVCGEPEKIIFEKFIKDQDGLYYNERLENESLKRQNFCESRKKSRSFGKLRTSNVRESYVGRTENDSENGIGTRPKKLKKAAVKEFDFEPLWQMYPRKDGKKEALKHFNATVLSQDAYERCARAVVNYTQSKACLQGDIQYIKTGKTFFNNWEDWVDVQSVTGKSKALLELEEMTSDK